MARNLLSLYSLSRFDCRSKFGFFVFCISGRFQPVADRTDVWRIVQSGILNSESLCMHIKFIDRAFDEFQFAVGACSAPLMRFDAPVCIYEQIVGEGTRVDNSQLQTIGIMRRCVFFSSLKSFFFRFYINQYIIY